MSKADAKRLHTRKSLCYNILRSYQRIPDKPRIVNFCYGRSFSVKGRYESAERRNDSLQGRAGVAGFWASPSVNAPRAPPANASKAPLVNAPSDPLEQELGREAVQPGSQHGEAAGEQEEAEQNQQHA